MRASRSVGALPDAVGDLMGTLDAGAAARALADAARPAARSTAVLPKPEDRFRPSFRPPPSKQQVRERLAGGPTERFDSLTRSQGGAFGPQLRLTPCVLDTWELSRLNAPDRSKKKAYSGIRYHAHPEPIPEPAGDLCTPLHRRWLEGHAVKRDKEIYPIFHAREKLAEAEQKLHNLRAARAVARDILTREHLDMPELSAGPRRSLAAVGKMIKVTRKFNKAIGVDNLAREDEKLSAEVEKLKKCDAMRLRPPTPEIRARHPKSWSGPDRPTQSRSLRHTTPWREQDAARALKGRSASAGALMRQTM